MVRGIRMLARTLWLLNRLLARVSPAVRPCAENSERNELGNRGADEQGRRELEFPEFPRSLAQNYGCTGRRLFLTTAVATARPSTLPAV